MSRSSFTKRVVRLFAALAAPVLVISTLTAIASSTPVHAADTATGPEPAGWYAGDIHVHRSCGSTAESLSSIKQKMDAEDLRFIALLADCGNGEVQDPTTDLPLVNGQDASVSTATRTVHWDSEWHWDATYSQYAHQALGGHLVNLGETSAQQVWDEMPSAIIDMVHEQGGISGFAHLQYLPSGIPDSLDCCTPVEYPVEVALGSADFISEDVTNTGDTAIEAYYKLLNTGFRPGFAAGTDYPCGNDVIGSRLTYSNLEGGDVTYGNWIDGIKSGRTVISRNGHNEFLDLTVNGSAGPGDEVRLASADSVPVTVTWTATQDYTGQLQLVQNGQVIASKDATVTAGSPVTLTASVDFARSGWVAARRMNADGNDHQVHTAAAFVLVDDAPIRVSASDAQFYIDWMDALLSRTAPGEEWNVYFPTELTAARARFQAAKLVFQQRKADATDTVTPTLVSHVPASSATGVAVGSVASVSFSEPIAQASVTASSVSLKAGSTVVPATLSVSGSTVTVTPTSALAFGTGYTVSVSRGVTDLAGNHLAAPVSWTFTTASGTLSTATPTITGSPGVGVSLVADPGSWGPAPVGLAYRWLRDGSAIPGATTAVYTVTTDDVGARLSVEVTGTKTGYTTASRTSAETVTIAAGMLSTSVPTISGTPGVGQVLTAEEGAWGPAPVAFSYQWYRGSTPVATARTYQVTVADVGSKLSVTVTGTKTGYTTASATSAATVTIAAGTFATATPTITGIPEIGQSLTAHAGSWDPTPDTLAYQWLRAGAEISGATELSYTVTAQDAGATLSVRVTGTKTGYTDASTTSSPTTMVPLPVLPPASPNPTIIGVARVGMPLTANLGSWNPTPTKVTYQWYWLKSSGARVTIKKATRPGYTPTGSVQGRPLQVRIKASVSGTTLTRYSPPSGKVGAPMTGKTPKISDTTPKVGQLLTARPGTWKPSRTTFTYQWYAKSTSGKVNPIPGATARTYVVDTRYTGYRLKVTVTGAAATYKPVTKTSAYTHKVT